MLKVIVCPAVVLSGEPNKYLTVEAVPGAVA